MDRYNSKEEYTEAVKARSSLPEGFRTAAASLTFFPREREITEPLPMNLSAIILDEPTSVFSGVFTKNRFPGAPVVIGRERIGGAFSRGVIINNKISNVGVKTGVADAERVLEAVGHALCCGPELFFPASTGIIGWRLPVEQMVRTVPELVAELSGGQQARSLFRVAENIMTTDRYPKVRAVECGEGRVVGIAKGAGMIEPNMATMLLFVMTDITIDRGGLDKQFRDAVAGSFNRISIDGDQSTSDMGLAFSSCKKPAVSEEDFQAALRRLCGALAVDVVRNGEGTNHVIHVTVTGTDTTETAVGIAKAVVNSPLVKTAVFGNDPNVGRIVSAIGDYAGNAGLDLPLADCTVSLGGETIFQRGEFTLDAKKEVRLSRYLQECALEERTEREALSYPRHENNVEIEIMFPAAEAGRRNDKTAGDYAGVGGCTGDAYGSDLSYGYVRENADYRT